MGGSPREELCNLVVIGLFRALGAVSCARINQGQLCLVRLHLRAGKRCTVVLVRGWSGPSMRSCIQDGNYV